MGTTTDHLPTALVPIGAVVSVEGLVPADLLDDTARAAAAVEALVEVIRPIVDQARDVRHRYERVEALLDTDALARPGYSPADGVLDVVRALSGQDRLYAALEAAGIAEAFDPSDLDDAYHARVKELLQAGRDK